MNNNPYEGMQTGGFVYQSVRLAVIDDIDETNKKVSIIWLDGLGGRDAVPLTYPYVHAIRGSDGIPIWYGVVSIPPRNAIVLVGLDSQGQARILQYMPTQSDALPAMKSGEIVLRSIGGGEIHLKDDGGVQLSHLSKVDNSVIYEINATPDGKLSIKASVEITIDAPSLNLGGTTQMARVGDSVSVDINTGVGTITSGSSKVKGG